MFIVCIWLKPCGVNFSFSDCLYDVLFNSFDELMVMAFIKGKCADQGLVQEIFVVSVRDTSAIGFSLFFPVYFTPRFDVSFPLPWYLRENVYSCPRIFTSLRIVGGGCAQRMRPKISPLFIEMVKLPYEYTEFIGISSNFIEGKEPVIDIKGCVLKALCHERSCELLESHDELNPLIFFIL